MTTFVDIRDWDIAPGKRGFDRASAHGRRRRVFHLAEEGADGRSRRAEDDNRILHPDAFRKLASFNWRAPARGKATTYAPFANEGSGLPSPASISATAASVTSLKVGGRQPGILSLSTIAARMPS